MLRSTATWVSAACLFAVGVASVARAADAIYPIGVVTAKDGTVFIADLNLPGILKWDGEQVSVYYQAPKQFRKPLNRVRCLAIDPQGKLLAGCTAARNVFRVEGDTEPSAIASDPIEMPMSLAVSESGELYVADLELRCIWKIPAGGKPEKFADVPPPRGIYLDKTNRLWVVSQNADQVIRLSADGKAREPVVRGTPFAFPHNIVVDDQENVFVTDGYEHAVWKIAPGKAPEKFVHGAPLDNPVGIARRGDELLVVDPRAKSLFRIRADGTLTAVPLAQGK